MKQSFKLLPDNNSVKPDKEFQKVLQDFLSKKQEPTNIPLTSLEKRTFKSNIFKSNNMWHPILEPYEDEEQMRQRKLYKQHKKGLPNKNNLKKCKSCLIYKSGCPSAKKPLQIACDKYKHK